VRTVNKRYRPLIQGGDELILWELYTVHGRVQTAAIA
jgi:hypothetical protein